MRGSGRDRSKRVVDPRGRVDPPEIGSCGRGATFGCVAGYMDLGDLISADGVVPALRTKDKKQALQELAIRSARLTGLAQRDVYEALLQRERLGSTGVGDGIAIPHARIAGLRTISCLVARLAEPIAFDAPDGAPVDLIFVLLAPEDAGADHLKALARIARLLREPEAASRLRAARDVPAILAILKSDDPARRMPLAG